MRVEMCVPHLSSDRIDSKAVFIHVVTTCTCSAQFVACYRLWTMTKKIQQNPHSKKQTKTKNNPQKLTCRSVPWILFCRMQGLVESGSPSSNDSTVCGTSFTITNGTRARPDISRERYTGECPHLEKEEMPSFCHPAAIHGYGWNKTKQRITQWKLKHISHKSNVQSFFSVVRKYLPRNIKSY